MRNSLLSIAVLSVLAVPTLSYAEEAVAPAAEAEPASAFTVTSNIGFVSDYYTRGISQTFHKPTVQGGFDIAHSSGFSVGVWGSGVTPNTFPDANTEIDLYANFGGAIADTDFGYSVGVIGYFYPGGSLRNYDLLTDSEGTKGLGKKKGGRFDTYEANFGLSYKWISAKASVTLGDWFGAEKETGWDGGTSGSTYIELNAAYPLPWFGLTAIGHVGHLNVSGKLSSDPRFANANNYDANGITEDNPDYTDYKVGLSKAFKIANSEGWNAGVYYVGASNGGSNGYWGDRGYGGSSFNGGLKNGNTEIKDLADGRFIVTVGRVF